MLRTPPSRAITRSSINLPPQKKRRHMAGVVFIGARWGLPIVLDRLEIHADDGADLRHRRKRRR